MVVPKMKTKVEMPYLFLVLESGRKKVAMGFWKDNIRQCNQMNILSIGNEPGDVSPAQLQFSEIYFQYFIPVGDRTFAAFELE